jgi:putative endonuclease
LFYVYIIRSLRNQRFYVGSTKDVEHHLHEHNRGKSTSTKAAVPWELIHSEIFQTRSEAVRQEQTIKARGIERYLSRLNLPDFH